MRIIFGIILASLCLSFAASASTVTSATLSVTNYAALTNATTGQSYTANSDTRTFTNSVANAAAQILVHTNDSASTIALSLAAQAGAYPFTGLQSLTMPSATNVTFRMAPDTALAITLSPTNWGRVTYSTQTVGTVQTIVRTPLSAESSATQTNVATELWQGLDSLSQYRLWSGPMLSNATAVGTFALGGGLGLHGALKTNSYTLATNDLYIGVDTRANTNLILTLPGAASASNLLFFLKDEGGAGATNTLKIYPASGDRIDTLLTNLVVSNNFGGVMLRSRGSTNWAILASGGGVTGGIAGSGGGVPLTNSVWVTKNGNNTTGARGDVSKAYLTLGAANTNAVSGDTIFVMPGTYDEAGIALKDGVNWNFIVGSEVVNTTNGSPIFSATANVKSRIAGSGVFTNAAAGGYEVLYQSGANSDIYFEYLRASGGHATDFYYAIRATDGALRVKGGTIVGWHYPAVLVSGAATAYFDGVTLDSTLNDQASLGSSLVTAATNVVTLRNCTVLGSNDGSWGATTIYSVHATSAQTVIIEGTLNANLPTSPNVTYANVDYAGLGEEHLAGNVFVHGNLQLGPTNLFGSLAPINIHTTNTLGIAAGIMQVEAGGALDRSLMIQTLPTAETSTVTSFFGLDVDCRMVIPGGTNLIYDYYGSRAFEADNNGTTNGQVVGVLGGTVNNSDANFGGIFVNYADQNKVFVGVTGNNYGYAANAGVRVGGYFEPFHDMNADGSDPIFESAGVLIDNRESGLPLLVARTNNGTTVFKVGADGAITFADGTVQGTAATAGANTYAIYAAGTAYSMTTTYTNIAFGTTSPTITIATAGTYLINANVGVKYNGLTYVTAQTATVKIRRTNNTPADITNAARTVELPVLTTFTGGDVFPVPPVIYTATAGDILELYGNVSGSPGAGSVNADSAEIVAVRLL